MKLLYLDNVRGFTKAFIPIMDVNFLVGENSTGKSSVLGILKLISNPRFWLEPSPDFNLGAIRFGHFRDIALANETGNNFFSIGMVDHVVGQDSQHQDPEALLLTFIERGGIPHLYAYCRMSKHVEICVHYGSKAPRYSHRDVSVPAAEDPGLFYVHLFRDWTSLQGDRDVRNYQSIPDQLVNFDKLPFDKLPFFTISNLLDAVLRGKHNEPSKRPQQQAFRLPWAGPEIVWLAPIRTKPRRTYDEYSLSFSPEGDHVPYLIKRILSKRSSSSKFRAFIGRIGKDSGLFDSIKTRDFTKDTLSPFELDVIMDEHSFNVSNVGYGVSQSLPVVVEIFERPKNTWFAIQQPEVHLHPRAQAALGDLFFEQATTESKKFFIETHSDFMIDRFRTNFRKTEKKNSLPSAQVLFFERHKGGNRITPLPISESGELPVEQPGGYRDFFIKEDMALLGI